MKTWEKFIRQELSKGFKNIQKRIEQEYYGFGQECFYDHNKVYCFSNIKDEVIIILTY